MNHRFTNALTGSLILLLVACSQQSNADASDARDAVTGRFPTMRIVRTHTFNSSLEHLETLKIAVGACRIAMGMPTDISVDLPPVDNIHMIEEEELFDGPRHALYSTTTVLEGDPAHGCALVGVIRRDALIETSCKERINAWSGNAYQWQIDRMEGKTGDSTPRLPEVTVEQTALHPCSERVAPENTAGAPVEILPGGARCIWANARLEHTLNPLQPWRAGPSPDGVDSCELAPGIVDGYSDAVGKPINIILRDHAPQTMLAARFYGLSADGATRELVSYEQDLSIPSSRFSRAAAEAFVRQPVVRTLGKVD